ncbi:MAG: ABC transporter ATP-binding protein [Bacteroidota bacterium]
MIEVQDLCKYYNGHPVVNQVTFEVGRGEKLILLGTSGSGKTTTLKMINRLVEPSAGTIRIEGQDILHKKPEDLRKGIGYVIQNAGLFPHYTVEQNIAVVPRLLKWDKTRTRQRVDELLEMMDLDPDTYRERFPRELSGGQRQRVGIARALAVNPSLLLMDEPFGALDPITRHQIHREFQEIESLKSRTMVMVTHDVFEALELGDKICLLDKGEIQQIGAPQELIFRPRNEFVRNFFQSQRFQLELKAIKMTDLLGFLEGQSSEGGKEITFSQEADLLEVMEGRSDVSQKNFHIQIQDEEKKPRLRIHPDDLMKAYYQFRREMLEAS